MRRRTRGSGTAAVVALLLLATVAPADAAAAKAPSATGLVAVTHHRVLDSVVKARTAFGFALTGVPTSGVSAVVLTVSVTNPGASGSLVVYPYGATRPGAVSLSFARGHGDAGPVVVRPGTRNRVLVYNGAAAAVRVSVTVTGYYAAAGSAVAAKASAAFRPLGARRLASVVLSGKASGSLPVLGKGGVPVLNVSGVAVEVTVSSRTRSGAVALYPYGGKAAHTTIAFTAGRTVTTLVVVKPGSRGRIGLTNSSGAATRVALDVVGYLLTLRPPSAPLSVAATPSSSAVLVSWRAPTDDGGTPVTGYSVVAQPGGAATEVGPAQTSASVGGLVNGTAYTLTVTAHNSRGGTGASTVVTPYTVPGSPGAPTATSPAAGMATVAWAPPTDTGGAAVTGYRVTASPGGVTATSPTPTVSMSLPGGSYYSFTVVALNAAGSSAPSVASDLALVQGIARVSSSPGGDPGNDNSAAPAVSQHGRFVAFQSEATNLLGQPTTGTQVFFRDRATGVTSLVSVATDGGPGNGSSTAPSISADGRYVVFSSAASNLVAGDDNGFSDVFVRDLQLGTTRLLSAVNGVPANQLSYQGVISADGTTAAFTSYATDLAPFDTGGHANVYVVSLVPPGPVTLVSETAAHAAATHDSGEPAISGDGKVVAFDSTDPVLQTAVTVGGNQFEQVYVRKAGATTLLSTAGGAPGDFNSGDPTVSSDGTYVAFDTVADNLVAGGNVSSQILVGDTATHVLALAAGGTSTASGEHPSISSDGTLVAYDTSVPLMRVITPGDGGHLQVFLAQWQQGTTVLVSAAEGVPGNGTSIHPALSSDGQHVAFESLASNLTAAPATNPSVQILQADLG